MTEGRELCRSFTQDIITFYEVSVAHCPEDTMRIFTRLLQSISHSKVAPFSRISNSSIKHVHRVDIKGGVTPIYIYKKKKFGGEGGKNPE